VVANVRTGRSVTGNYTFRNAFLKRRSLQVFFEHTAAAAMGACTSSVIVGVDSDASFVYSLPVDLLLIEVFPLLSPKSLRRLDVGTRCQGRHLPAFNEWMATRPVIVKANNIKRVTSWYTTRNIFPAKIQCDETLISDKIMLALPFAKEAKEIVVKGHMCSALWRFVNLGNAAEKLRVLHVPNVQFNQLQLTVLLKDLPNLEELHLRYFPRSLPYLPRLTSLYATQAYLPSTSAATAVARACPHLTGLHLARLCLYRNPTGLAQQWAGLRKLSLVATAVCPVEVMDAIAQHCGGITSLDVSHNTNTSNSALIDLGRNLPLLQELRLSGSYHITDTKVALIARACSELRILGVDNCLEVTDESLRKLAEHCPALQELHCGNCPRLTQQGKLRLALDLPHVRVVQGMVWPRWW
jgi:hypothetical protein